MEEKLDKIIELLETIANNTGTTYKGYPKWDQAQEELLISLHNQEVDIPEMISVIKDTFGIERSTGAIIARLNKLELISSRKAAVEQNRKVDRPIIEEDYTLGNIYDDDRLPF